MTIETKASALSKCCGALILSSGTLRKGYTVLEDNYYYCMKCEKKCEAPSVQSQEEMERLLDVIDKDVFACGDALQNAYYTLKGRRQFDSAAVDKAEEYLREWPPVWMRDETFTPAQVPEKIGTDKIREYLRTLQSQLQASQVRVGELEGQLEKEKHLATTLAEDVYMRVEDQEKLLADWRRMRGALHEIEQQGFPYKAQMSTLADFAGIVLSSLSYTPSPENR